MNINDFFSVSAVLLTALLGVLGLILLNTVLGIAISIGDHKFDLNRLPQFIKTKITAYYLALVAVVGAAQINYTTLTTLTGVDIAIKGLAGTFIAAYITSLLKEIWDKVKTITTNLNN